jgi:uncharacterized protein (TIRG00374 family)
MTKSRIIDLLKLALALGLLVWLFLRLPDPAALWLQILHANKVLLLLGALCYTAAVALSGLKWGVLLRAAGIQVPATRLLTYQWMAEFFNNFLPAQVGGDVMRGYAVAVDTRRKADATASVLIDRFIGLIIFMLFAALASTAMLLWGKPDGTAFTAEGLIFMRFAAVGSVIFTVALCVAVTALLSRRLKRLFERLLALLPFSARTLPIWNKLAAAFDVYRDHLSALALTALGSAAIVVLTSVNIWLIAWAVEPNSISLLEVLAINPIIVFALLVVPLSPGGLGVRQVSFAGLFLFIGAGAALGTAVGLLQQFIGYLVSLPGGYFWVRSGRRRAGPTAVDGT